MKRTASTFVLFLLVCSVVCFSQIEVAHAQTKNYIHEDGTVEGTTNIERTGNYYRLTGDVDGPLIVEKDYIIIDGAGYTLFGNSSFGVQ
ncbi:MAG: hypothetical protein NWF03_02355, partial [Candidatus Bathyarchaeota archaeon]|nr:hypothetical protein [Candidatus Bathyarchaeota archaeon]